MGASSPAAPWSPATRPRLRQVLNNLVTNALHAHPAGHSGHVGTYTPAATTTRSSRLAYQLPGGSRPIRPERVFERFYRVDKGPAPGAPYGGSGLASCTAAPAWAQRPSWRRSSLAHPRHPSRWTRVPAKARAFRVAVAQWRLPRRALIVGGYVRATQRTATRTPSLYR